MWRVESPASPTTSAAALTEALIAIEWQVVSDTLAKCRHRFRLHGAALSTPSGRASILLLGASGSGKTTLALALMARGFVPFADDVTFVDSESLSPLPFQRAFHADEPTRALVERLRPSPQLRTAGGLPPGYAQPLRWADVAAPIGTIFFPALQQDEPPAVAPLSIAEAAATLLPFSATLDQAPKLALRIAAKLIRRARAYTLRSGGLEATADLVATVASRAERRAR